MSDALTFSLVSPERELYTGDATSVVVPGTEGLFEVMAGHSPVMSTLSPGMLVIRKSDGEKRYFVRGGFADVTPSGLTVLAETAIPEDELKGDVLAREKQIAGEQSTTAGTPEEQLDGSRAAAILEAV